MKKRILSVLLSFALLAAMLPTAALAVDDTTATRTVTVKNFWGPGDGKDKTFTYTVGEHANLCLEYAAGSDPDGYVFGGFVSDDDVVKSSGPEYRNMVFDMPDRDVTISVNWVPEGEMTYVFTLKSAGNGATISVGGKVLATSSAAGSTITANVSPGAIVTVYAGERNSEKKKCSYWRSYGAYSISQDLLPSLTQRVSFQMPNGPAELTAYWDDAYWVTVKNYNGTETKDPVLYLPKEQIDIDVGTYAGHACTTVGGVTVRDTGKTTWTTWHATQGIHANLIHFIQQTLSRDVDIELKWVDYDLTNVTVQGGGTGASGGGVYTCAYSPTVPISAGANPGHTFSYWSSEGYVTINDPTQADTTVKLVDTTPGTGASTPVSATLTAHWDEEPPTKYGVSFIDAGNGATGAGSYAPGETVTIKVGTKEGYRFNGWTVCSSTATLADSSSAETTFTMPSHQVTLQAEWKEGNLVKIAGGGEGATGGGYYAYRDTVVLDPGTKQGYHCTGWTVTTDYQWTPTVDFTIINGDQASFTMPNLLPTTIVTATASWEIDPNAAYAVTVTDSYAAASGEGSYAEGATVTLDAGTREGYTFSGWMVTSGTVTLADASSARTTFIMPAGDVTVTANWTQNRHTLTIKGLPGGDRTETHAAGESVTVSAGTKAGYTFAGWTSNPVFLYTGTPDATFSMPGYDLTVLAVWTPEPDADGAVTLYLDELPGPLIIDAQGYCCGEPGNFQHSFTGPYILTQRDPGTATANTVTVSKDGGKSEFAITLKGVNIASADQAALLVNDDAKLTLTLQGGNTLKGGANHAGLELKATARIPETAVVINGTAQDSLTAAGGDYGAGIGGAGRVCYNSITINGGVISATGGKGAAGIGSGNTYAPGDSGEAAGPGHSDDITINGGTVTATGTADSSLTYPSGALLGAAGIGAGYGPVSDEANKGPYSIITVTGGDVTATGVGKAPAIGGTYTGIITISGGTVTTHRGDNQSTAEIGKHPDASGGICQVRLSDWQGTKVGSAQIFVSGPNAISDKPASPTGTDNYYWNAIVYEGDSGQLYCSYYNSTQAMELDALTVPAGKTLSIPRGVILKLPQDGLHWDGASFAGEGRVILGETYHYAKADGKLTPCEAKLVDDGGLSGIFNTLEGLITGTIANDGSTSWLVYSGHHITLLADVDYPADLDLTGTRCTELEIDLNGKTLNMGNHTILADVESSTVAENNVFTISDSSAEGSGKIVGSSDNPLVRSTTGRLVITGGALENSGAGPAVQMENVRPELKLSGGSFSRLAVVANTGFTPTPLVELLAEGCAFRGTEDQIWVSPVSKRPELSNVSIQAAPAGLLPLTAVHGAGSNEVSVSGLESASASYQWAARSYEGGGSAALPGATGPVLYLNDGTLEEGYYYVSCQVTVNGLTIATDEVYAEAEEPAVTLTVAEGTYVYSGTAHRPAVTVTAKDGTVLTEGTDYTLTYEDNVNAGAARVVVQGTEDHPFDTVRKSFQIDRAPLSVQAKDQTVQQGADIQSGSSMVSAEGLVPGDTLTDIVLAKSGDNTQISPSDAHIRNAAGQDVTGNYEITYRPGALTVTSGGGGGSPGGSGSSGGSSSGGSSGNTTQNPDGSTTTVQTNPGTGTVTETTKRPDGSTTVVEKRRDGTVTTTETDPDGGRTETVERPDGSASITTQAQDGTTARTSVAPSGQVESSVSLSQEALTAAQADGGAVSLPLPPVQAQTELAQAAAVTIQAPAEGPVKVEIPVSNATQGTVAVLVREDGTTEILKRTVPGEAGVSFEVESGATVKIVDNSKRFDDVEQTSWAAPAVEFAAARELFAGVSETSFAPEQPMTRGMVMTVLARLDGQDTAGGSTWYEPGLSWAQSNGISDGTQPMSNVSREQLVLMLYRYAGSPETADTLLSFPDNGQISAYARDAMCWAVSNGILHGTGSGLLDPQGPATRAQVAQIFENYIRMP